MQLISVQHRQSFHVKTLPAANANNTNDETELYTSYLAIIDLTDSILLPANSL